MDDLEKRFAAVWEEVRQESAAREAEERAAGSVEKIQGEQIRNGSREKSTKQNATKRAEKPKQATIAEPLNSSLCLPSVADVEVVERVKGEVLDAATSGEVLPEEVEQIKETMRRFVDSNIFGNHENMTPEEVLKKEVRSNPQIWGSLCSFVGAEYMKKYGVCRDHEYIKKHGTNRLNPFKVSAYADFFIALCADYGAMPFIMDFSRFLGMSWDYFNEKRTGKEALALTSSQVGIRQKFKQFQEIDLSRRLGHGVQNPAGAIFVLKNLHGWKDERTVEHVDGTQTALKAAELPRLDGLVGATLLVSKKM